MRTKNIFWWCIWHQQKKQNNTTQSSCAHINQARPNWKVPRLVRIDNGLQTLTLRGCVCVCVFCIIRSQYIFLGEPPRPDARGRKWYKCEHTLPAGEHYCIAHYICNKVTPSAADACWFLIILSLRSFNESESDGVRVSSHPPAGDTGPINSPDTRFVRYWKRIIKWTRPTRIRTQPSDRKKERKKAVHKRKIPQSPLNSLNSTRSRVVWHT